MSTALPAGGRAIMSQRLDPVDSLDFFPTPPWATRALCEVVLWPEPIVLPLRQASVWEPAAGEGHMAFWIITNPPFNLAVEFAERALALAKQGVALLTRTSWLEGGERYKRLFSKWPPIIVALFAERVPMVKGWWDPKASTATSYAWVVWDRTGGNHDRTRLMWIPPGRRAALTKPDDVARFA